MNWVIRRAAIPMISLVQATCERGLALGFHKLGLLGTGFTMRGQFYPEVFEPRGITLVKPRENEMEFIHQAYIGELLKNKFLPETRTKILDCMNRMRREDRIEGVILAGTELPLLLRGAEPEGLAFLDTTLIHVEAAVSAIVGSGAKS